MDDETDKRVSDEAVHQVSEGDAMCTSVGDSAVEAPEGAEQASVPKTEEQTEQALVQASEKEERDE